MIGMILTFLNTKSIEFIKRIIFVRDHNSGPESLLIDMKKFINVGYYKHESNIYILMKK